MNLNSLGASDVATPHRPRPCPRLPERDHARIRLLGGRFCSASVNPSNQKNIGPSKDIPRLEEELGNTRIQFVAASSEIATLRARVNEIQKRRSEWELEIGAVGQEIERRSAEIESLESGVILLTHQDALAKKIRDKRQQIEIAAAKLQIDQNALRDLLVRQDAMRERLQTLEGEVEQLRVVESRLVRASYHSPKLWPAVKSVGPGPHDSDRLRVSMT